MAEAGQRGLRGFRLSGRTQQRYPTGPGETRRRHSETTVLEHPL